MADQMCLDQIWGVIRPIITITTNFLNPSLLFQVHEALRNFYDRLLLPKEMDAVFQCIRNCVKSIFRENFDSAFEHLGKVDGQVYKNNFMIICAIWAESCAIEESVLALGNQKCFSTK